MAKHRRIWNEKTYRNHLREGRGQGAGSLYKPWIMVQDFASKGMVSRAYGEKTGRVHHLLSNHETHFFYLLDWSDSVIDIREQYPLLDLREAVEIAERSGIRYPYDSASGFPYVLTSDFFIETTNGIRIRTIKSEADLQNMRVREKLEIERRYWQNRKTDWKIVTENEINRQKARNIEWLSQAKDLDCLCIPSHMQASVLDYFLERYCSDQQSLCGVFAEVERRFALLPGTGLNIFKHLAYWKKVEIDINAMIERIA